MSDQKNNNNNPEHLGTSGIYNQLLAVATAAKGNEKMDSSIGLMSESDRKWLENAMNDFACQTDPTKKLKSLIALLMNYKHETSEDLKTLTDIVDSLIDLVCQVDFALDFCKLNGLKVIESLLDRNDDEIDQRIIGIVSEISQNNPPVQKLVVTTSLLTRFLNMIQSSTVSQITRLKVAGAISSIVKCHPPALVQFVKANGPDIMMSVFHKALEADDEKLVHRCVVSIMNIGISAAPELITALKVDVGQYVESIRAALLTHGASKYSESLAYINS